MGGNHPQTDGFVSELLWFGGRSFLCKDNGKAHCPSAGTAAYSDAVKELSWDVSQDRRSCKKSCSELSMAMTTTETQLGGANRHQSSVGDVSGLASCQVWEVGSGHCGESSKHLRKFRLETLNVNTLRGRVCEVVETLSCRKVAVCCNQETRYRGGNCRIFKGKDTRYKLYWSGNDKGTAV